MRRQPRALQEWKPERGLKSAPTRAWYPSNHHPNGVLPKSERALRWAAYSVRDLSDNSRRFHPSVPCSWPRPWPCNSIDLSTRTSRISGSGRGCKPYLRCISSIRPTHTGDLPALLSLERSAICTSTTSATSNQRRGSVTVAQRALRCSKHSPHRPLTPAC